jgi:hypothetical protein
MNHDDSPRGNGRSVAGEERAGDESRGKKAGSDFPQLREAEGRTDALSSGGGEPSERK